MSDFINVYVKQKYLCPECECDAFIDNDDAVACSKCGHKTEKNDFGHYELEDA